MKQYKKVSLAVIAAIFAVNLLPPANAGARTVISSPVGGECFIGGSTIDIAWNISGELLPARSYIAYGVDGKAPTRSQSSNIPGGDSAGLKGVMAWQLPQITGDNVTVHVTSISLLNTVNSSAVSGIFSIDSTPPSAPAVVATTSGTTTTLSWSPVANPGCVPLLGYKVFRDGNLVATITETSFIDTNRPAVSTAVYQVHAYDAFMDTASSPISVATPAAPQRASNQAGSAGSSRSGAANQSQGAGSDDKQNATDPETSRYSDQSKQVPQDTEKVFDISVAGLSLSANQGDINRLKTLSIVYAAVLAVTTLAALCYAFRRQLAARLAPKLGGAAAVLGTGKRTARSKPKAVSPSVVVSPTIVRPGDESEKTIKQSTSKTKSKKSAG